MKEQELSRVQIEKSLREQELTEKLEAQLHIRSEINAAHDENDENEDECQQSEYGKNSVYS